MELINSCGELNFQYRLSIYNRYIMLFPIVRDLAMLVYSFRERDIKCGFVAFVCSVIWPRSRSSGSDVFLSTSINARRLIESSRARKRDIGENRLCENRSIRKNRSNVPANARLFRWHVGGIAALSSLLCG